MPYITARQPAAGIALALLASVGAQAASYRVFPVPVASPDHGARVLATNPHQLDASPFGWHDTNGVAGAEFTTLRGNNVTVYTDIDANNASDGPGPDGGAGLLFDFAWSPANPPSSYKEALATNAFYWANMLHDIFWRHGFNEAARNMQANNYGRGGVGNDPLIVEIMDGSGINNANGSSTADGVSPRIQLYEWNATSPRREGSFDATTFLYAYGMVLHARIAGTSCNGNAERPASGYNDFFGILLTTNFAHATPTQPRGLGTYVLGQPVNGTGIRTAPYTTDFALNRYTYNDTRTLAVPHGVGFVWASMLWEVTWGMVARHGASNDWFNGNGAENRMLRLAIRAMQLQPCQSGFVDARTAWLAADDELYAGENRCILWRGFARRGLGASAVQGSAGSNSDNTEAFDLPADCADLIFDADFDP
ncbi:MAG TPA: M36 family metallopeptidase [Tahibacter sp.]|uniref:M36 family metallopeptidase n=1 Tax=Tahibacter sp. TaxID=2056211 RepID=UPI002BE7B775|nr:M36 family metallopeptidase [Tahibacter sp.]HSX62570.1 M36 family metallopeptidase [Tahibacter sp.]